MDIERNTSCSTVSSFDEGMLFEDPGSNTSCSTVSDDEEMSPELTTIELVKGSSCRITREQLDQVIMTTVGRKPEVMNLSCAGSARAVKSPSANHSSVGWLTASVQN
ncbi:uncharacterized protein [Apostichopus japonicus]|uniref:uncharacterized protein isoform X3 n=1 Tax=Stichopus japonicus TaxID=307972 RepID=UPI003AB52172